MIPIKSTLGALISGMCFLIIHIILFRIAVAYYLLKLTTEEEKQKKARKITLYMYIHVALYVTLVLLQSFLDYLNDQRLDVEYHVFCFALKSSY